MTRLMPAERERPAAELVQRLERNIAQVIRGKPAAIRHAVLALLARGHLLIEDVPGVGKTTLARALALSMGGAFHRIQFTSDLLPSDILGVSVLDTASGQFVFRPGPLFANVVLADEINRTTPRTQSALLEAMNDGQVSLDGHTYRLEPPFMVIATQNSEEHYGTYPLPESQMDRFTLRIRIDYPSADDEKSLILEAPAVTDDALAKLRPAVLLPEIISLQDAAARVRISPELAGYIVDVARETRRSPFLALGLSPRGELAWRNVARAAAMVAGRDYVLPDDLKQLALPTLAHRLVLANQLDSTGRVREEAERVVMDVLNRLPIPG
ncbi:MAG TPA: MoxR family ATPase [Polyangia bacterium]|nr:MoxR family ATPase [Polyangia bacterium]